MILSPRGSTVTSERCWTRQRTGSDERPVTIRVRASEPTKQAPAPPGLRSACTWSSPTIQAAREDLVKRGIGVSAVFHYAAGPTPFGGRVSGIAPVGGGKLID
jgi:hypothetical protein